MQNVLRFFLLSLLMLGALPALASNYEDTINNFRNAIDDEAFFRDAYGYAVFPTVGKGGMVVGGAYGEGRVYEMGNYVGDTKMTQVTLGFQLGGQAYSQIVFFQDKRAFDEFTSGNFEFGAQTSAVALTTGAQASASTSGASAGYSGGQHDAKTTGTYYKGMAVFIVAKGGLMYEASVGGQKFSYSPR
jgi:lipid-binding SYLF domain-containing protein